MSLDLAISMAVATHTFIPRSLRPPQHRTQLEQILIMEGIELGDGGRGVAVVGVEFFDEPFGRHWGYRYIVRLFVQSVQATKMKGIKVLC